MHNVTDPWLQLHADFGSERSVDGARESLTALAVSSINNLVNAEGDTQAAWRNRIPVTAWFLMATIAIFSTLLVGIGVRRNVGFSHVLAILPLIISIAFYLIADIESPRLGIISVVPDNLLSLAEMLRGR